MACTKALGVAAMGLVIGGAWVCAVGSARRDLEGGLDGAAAEGRARGGMGISLPSVPVMASFATSVPPGPALAEVRSGWARVHVGNGNMGLR